MEYILDVKKDKDFFYVVCDRIRTNDGRIEPLRNKSYLRLANYEKGLSIVSGYHIGMRNFDFYPGDEGVINFYQPGLWEQILIRIEMEKHNEENY